LTTARHSAVPRYRRLAVGGLVGPIAFISCWALGGLLTEGYSPVDDAISRLAAVDVDTRWLMTAGFVAFGVGVPLFGLALREVLPGRAWIAAVVTGLATLGVALLPLDVSDTVDALHGVAAGTGYVALALLPVLASRPLRSRASLVLGLAIAACLVLTLVEPIDGLAQRTGLTLGDLWILWASRAILTHRLYDEA
jgi:hypothetical membrane protein